MKNILWSFFAWIVSRKPIADLIIRRAMKTPYWHLDGYMNRYWLFNGYPRESKERRFPGISLSIRIHHILREDHDRDHHNHPFDARTVILRGWYAEDREGVTRYRDVGHTTSINRDTFHRISDIHVDGCWTMFIIFKTYDKWGFKTPQGFVQSDKYFSKNNKG